MKVSALITVYNRPKMAIACLRALALNTRLVDEVIVSDDGSDEQCVRAMQGTFNDFPFPVRYVRQEHNDYRLAAARNNAIRAARGDYLVSLDCDILLLPDTIETHLRYARQGLFIAGDRALLRESNTNLALKGKISARMLATLWDEADKNRLAKTHYRFQRNRLLRRLGLSAPHKPKILGCHFSLFREDAERVNGFDEKFVGWGLEDDDFARRLYKTGLKGKSVIREARALHLWHPSVGSKPQKISVSPNMAYFKRANVPPYCAAGLNKTRSEASE
ncbi:MAG: glycosyltransferase [Kiritimatiellia bacterium]|nr:glycosyltransferase [Kiritimatiellia bacterium]